LPHSAIIEENEDETSSVAGNGTFAAAKRLGWTDIQVVRVPADWTADQIKAFALADNRTAELAKARQRLSKGEDPEKVLEALASGLVNKMLHHPTQALNRAVEGERDSLVRAVEILFPDNGTGNGRES
jgi:hypothetical protein